jgi:hypothetical protein
MLRTAPSSISSSVLRLISFPLLISLAACGGGGGSSNNNNGGSSASVTVAITPATATMNAGATQQFSVVIDGTTDKSAGWDVDGIRGGNAQTGTISSAGLYHAPATAGTHKVGVTSGADASKSAHATVTVVAAGPTVSISPTSASVTAGATRQFTASVTGTSNTAVTWFVDGVASGNTAAGTITASGLYSAPGTPGTHTVTVTSAADSTQHASATVTVTAPTPVSVAINPTTASVNTSKTQQFTATVSGTGNTAVTWSVDDIAGGNATVGTVSGSGLYTAPAAAGAHQVTATSVADASKSASASITVTSTTGALTGVFTFHYDNQRTGAYTGETTLTPANVNVNQFGKLFTYSLDGYSFGQPLYAANLQFADGVHNAVYVATQNDSVYAFDADGKSSVPLWHASFINAAAGITTVPCAEVDGCFIGPNIGITSTPVIDPSNRAVWVLARTKENGAYVHKLHALDLTSGAEKFGGPVVISATVSGAGLGTQNGIVPFANQKEHNRPALMLLNGLVYCAFASLEDQNPYHGWILGYGVNPGSNTISQVAVYNSTPNGGQGGIWSAGGLTADLSGNIFVETGNGTFNGGTDLGDSFIRVSTAGGVLQNADYFTPFDQSTMNGQDLDLGSGGPLILPDQPGTAHPHLLVGGGKTGTVYLVDRDNMGHNHASDNNQIVQSVTGQLSQIFTTPAYWNGRLYYSSQLSESASPGVPLVAFSFSNGQLSTTPISKTSVLFQYAESPIVTSNGSNSGILWITQHMPGANGVLRAYDATNLAHELYNSNQNNARDGISNVPAFGTAMVFNGKLYLSTKDLGDSQAKFFIFGLLP